MAKGLKDRIQSESRAAICITNANMVCKDCLLRYDDSKIMQNTTRCEAFPEKKPDNVLMGRKCDQYVKE